MYPSFTGSAKSRRQVNLSGRNNNPFATYGSSKPAATAQPASNAVAHAQQERILRENERRRPPAAARIQRTWRGHKSRCSSNRIWRQYWDEQEAWGTAEVQQGPYATEADTLQQLRLLAQFASSKSEQDTRRICHFAHRCLATASTNLIHHTDAWIYPSSRLAKALFRASRAASFESLPSEAVAEVVDLLALLASISAPFLATYSEDYYHTINLAVKRCHPVEPFQRAVTALIDHADQAADAAYRGFGSVYLTQAVLPGFDRDLDDLVGTIDYAPLVGAVNHWVAAQTNQQLLTLNDSEDSLLWLLSRLIFIHQNSKRKHDTTEVRDSNYVNVISRLISVLSREIGQRLDTIDHRLSPGSEAIDGRPTPLTSKRLPDFVQTQLLSLINQASIGSLLAKLQADTATSDSAHEAHEASAGASALASYVLTLLRVFPQRKGDIQMWLYRGSINRTLPATKYFYQAASSTSVFRSIQDAPANTIHFLASDRPGLSSGLDKQGSAARDWDRTTEEDWRIILLFLELCTFTFQVMDDEEFLSGSSKPLPHASWTRQSALPLIDIENLTTFLKNLAFAMYYYATEIAGEPANVNRQSLAAYFGKDELRQTLFFEAEERLEEQEVGGVNGMTVDYVKGLVVGVLRMIYQRDSRRKFLPKDHWLMTNYFEMDRFISAVVEEEEHGRQVEESYDALEDQTERSARVGDDTDSEAEDMALLVGTQRTRNLRHSERLKSQQRKASKKKYLESVTPRLKILENMPFFIPFHTRVEIFRQFVNLDQIHRRETDDADEWRYRMMNSVAGNISKHRATVRREQIFDDAYKQFYDLNEGLKEPIQIRFVDKFGTVEEGIDGGGVTKEFLTSITNEAFGASNGLESLFIENDQHLLFPNPSAVEERKETLRQSMLTEGSSDWNETIRDLLRRYEFLGRIVGKCLYEGILIDIHFAPFFLLKWALTGGSGSASKETGYRANLNDLRDLDESLYQGLLQLKNYPGDVESDFSLNFAVTDTLELSPTQTKTITRELRPGGENMPVTNENRLVYIASIARYRLQLQPYQQTSAFLRGLGTIISPSWLSMFNQSELQTLIGGSGAEVSIADLRKNTQYGGIYVIGDDGMEHPSIQLFWKVMESLDMADVAKVLKFVTSTPRAPLLGFGNLTPKFSIRDSGSDQTRLPSTSTCVNLLKLPIYRDEKVLKDRLLYSINAGAGFNLS